MPNNNLTNAKMVKNDEFYTQYSDIQKEIEAYLEYDPDTFKGKVVYSNCDDPFESNFFRYFALNFKRLGLKRLITTSYKPSPIANTQLGLFGDDETIAKDKGRPKITANKLIINEVGDIDGDGAFTLQDIAEQLKENKHNEWTPLEDDGDFRSEECMELLKQSDIVVTNPPFSLFREYIKQLFDYGKKFVIIANMNAITYKEVFPLIKDNKLWLGATGNGSDMVFAVPNGVEIAESDRQKAARLGYVGDYTRLGNSCWFTNLDHGRRHKPLNLMTMSENLKFNKKMKGKVDYNHYDNYDAIEVPFTNATPSDYDGVMGVPISFLDRYSPEQFEIVGLTTGRDEFECIPSKRYKNPVQHNADGTISNGSKANTRATILMNEKPAGIYYTADNAAGPFSIVYARILIKHRKATV